MFLVSCIVQNISISAQIIPCSLETLLSIYFLIGLYFILFSFQFILFLELKLGISGMSQVTVTLSHDHVP